MNYEFPIIKTIDDVLPSINGRDEFIIAERDGHVIVNYAVAFDDSFPVVKTTGDAIRRECRGMMFNAKGELISRPLHKFFNCGEREETLPNAINLSTEHLVFDKLDGSMIRPVYINDQIRWCTKMGLSEVALRAEAFAKAHAKFDAFASYCLGWGMTPIFEWCSPTDRIVVNYTEPNLVLIAIRRMENGKYLSFDEMRRLAEPHGISIVKIYEAIDDIVSFMERVKNEVGIEGYIIRFHDGHMLKIKCAEYLVMHKSKDISSSNRKIWQLIIDEKIDDLKAALVREDLDRVNQVEKEFWIFVQERVDYYKKTFNIAYYTCKGDKKTFAIEHRTNYSKLDQGIIFSLWDGKDLFKLVLDSISRHLSTETKYEEFLTLTKG